MDCISEEIFKLLFNKANDVILFYTFAEEGVGKFLLVNDVACSRLGYTREEFFDMTIYDINPEHSRVDYALAQARQTGKWIFEGVHMAKDGRQIPVEVNAHLFEMNGQEVILAIARDISKWKRAEAEINAINRKLQDVIHTSPLAVFVLEAGRITIWNKPAERLLGVNGDAIFEQSLSKLFELVGMSHSNVQDLVAKGADHNGEQIKIIKKDGSEQHLIIYSHRLPSYQNGLLISVQDITANVLDQREVQEAKEKANQFMQIASLGAMIAGVTHEIIQPLNSLKVTADSLIYWLEQGMNLSTEKMLGKLRLISRQVDRISESIVNVRTVIGRGQSLQLTPCHINALVGQSIELIHHQQDLGELAIIQEVGSDLPEVLASESGLQEVFTNILVNAIQALDGKLQNSQKILVRTWYDQKVYISISDNGTGIAAEIIDKIFDPFFSTKKGTGMGLGLFISYGIITGFGGKISVHNNEFGGATFTIGLPACHETQANPLSGDGI